MPYTPKDLDSFRRRWPALGEHVCEELLDCILAIKPRRKSALAVNGQFTTILNIAMLIALVIYLKSPAPGSPAFWIFQSLLWSNIFLNRRARRTEGPFSLTRVLSHQNGILAPDLWLTGLSYQQMAATEAAVAYLRKPAWWKSVLGMLVSILVFGFALRVSGLAGWNAVIAFLPAFLLIPIIQLIAAPILRVRYRLKDIYAASSVEGSKVVPVFTGAVSAKGSRGMRVRMMTVFVTMFVAVMLFTTTLVILPANLRQYSVTGLMTLALIGLPLIWLAFIPKEITSLFTQTSLDGNARFRQLVEKIVTTS